MTQPLAPGPIPDTASADPAIAPAATAGPPSVPTPDPAGGDVQPGQAIRPAVTVLLFSGDDRLLMVRRSPRLKSFAGHWAFPGGRVDAEDHASPRPPAWWAEGHAAGLGGSPDADTLADLHGLGRELAEETGLMLHTLGVRAIYRLGEATTPPQAHASRFRTRFYRIDLTLPARDIDAIADGSEIVETGWDTPAGWYARWARGHLLLATPTWACIDALFRRPDATRLAELDFENMADRLWRFEQLGGLGVFGVKSNTIPPATRTNCFHLGDGGPGAPRLLVDPSPANDTEYARLTEALDRYGSPEAIFITHHHPDHRERADRLARERHLPILCSQDTFERTQQKTHGRFFAGITHVPVAEGDVVTRVHGIPVRALAVPGHDEGQLALMPDDKAWCLVSDLYQGIGTVVVGGPEGDMAKYMASLERIIALAPTVVFPSHGPASGGTWRLEEVLAHRRARETQFATFLATPGASEDDLLAHAYPDLDPRLAPLARLNIASHLVKLRAEGRLPPVPEGL